MALTSAFNRARAGPAGPGEGEPGTAPGQPSAGEWPRRAHNSRAMEHQIARNRRRSTVLVISFFVVWAAVGALIGLLAGSGSGAAGGAVIAIILALLVMGWSLTFGRRTVLSLAGAVPADPQRYPELHHVVEALAIGDGIPKPEI